MSKAAELAALIGSQTALSNRNLIINGAMNVAQRATSSTGQTSGGYKTCDRWRVSITNQGTWTISQSSTTPNGEFSSSLKFDCTTADASPAASDQVAVETRLEAQDVTHLGYGNSDAKAVTVSFWVRSNKTGTYTFEIYAQDPDRINSTTYTIDSANTWEKKEITVPADTSGSGITDDTGIGIIVKWWLGAGSTFTGGTFTNNVWEANVNANRVPSSQVNLADSTSNEWYITGIQLEVGEQATPFEHRSFGDELLKCYRYCYVWNAVQAFDPFTDLNVWNSTTMLGQYVLPVQMNHDPAIEVSAASDFVFSAISTDRNITAMSLNRATPREVQILATDTDHGFSSGVGGFLRDDGNSNATVTLEAEL